MKRQRYFNLKENNKFKIRTNLECPAHEYCAAWGLKLVSDVRVVNGSYEFWVEV